MIKKLADYLAGAQQEFKLIKWPNFSETKKLTLIVIGMSLLIAAFLGAFDYLFTFLLGRLI